MHKHDRMYLDIFGWLCVSMECIEFRLDSKIFKVMEARRKNRDVGAGLLAQPYGT